MGREREPRRSSWRPGRCLALALVMLALATAAPAAGAAAPAAAWTSRWWQVAAAPSARFEAAAVTVGGRIYVFGGFKADYRVDRTYASYDPAGQRWRALGTLPVGMAETHLGIATDGQHVYVAGGFGGDLQRDREPGQWISDAVWRYTPGTNRWQRIATLPRPRGAGSLDVVGRELHYLSGNPADRVTNVGDHFVFHLDGRTWRTAAPLPNPKDHFSTVVHQGRIYVLGGEKGHDELHRQQRDAHVYTPATNTWRRLADLPVAKSHLEAATFVSDGRFVMAGGQRDNFAATANVIAYDPSTNRWSTLASLPAARQGAVVQRVGTRLVVSMGAVRPAAPQRTTWHGSAG